MDRLYDPTNLYSFTPDINENSRELHGSQSNFPYVSKPKEYDYSVNQLYNISESTFINSKYGMSKSQPRFKKKNKKFDMENFNKHL